jgi:hypothetical protein
MVILGEVFHDANFVFQDGEQGNKLFIILAIADSLLVVARTTSKSSGKIRSYGCHHDDRFPNFYIPLEASIFDKDTWVCLDYLVDFNPAGFNQKATQGNIRKITALSSGVLIALLECAITSDDITVKQEQLFRESIKRFQSK